MISLLHQIHSSIAMSPSNGRKENEFKQNIVRSFNGEDTLNKTINPQHDVSLSIKKYGIRETGRFVHNSPVFESGNSTV
jgi:hypothetical protein